MSRKRFNPLEDPPNASSSDEEDEVERTSLGDGEEVDGNSSSEEEEDDERVLSKPEKQQVSDSESGSGEETDTDSETKKKHPVKKSPVSSAVKPVTGTKDSVVPKKKQDSKKVKPLAKSATKKRSLSETDGAAAASTDAKRVKKGSGEETKKNYFQRVWSEEDEIAALQGLVDYKKDTGVNPYDDTNAFYGSVKKSISFDVSKTQVMEKLRGLRKKYENNLVKGKKGEEPTFSKPHDRKAFDLSKLVWGADGMALESAVKSNGKSNKSRKSSKKVEPVEQELASSSPNGKSREEEVANKGDASSIAELDAFVKSLARFGVDDLSAQQGWSRLASEDKKRFEEQWKVLQLREFEFYSQKSGFLHEVVTKMAEAFRPNP